MNGSEPRAAWFGQDTEWLSPSPDIAQGSGNNLKSKCLSLLSLPSPSVVCVYVLDSQLYVTSAPYALCPAMRQLMCGVIPSLTAQGCSGCLQVVSTCSSCACVCMCVCVGARVHVVTNVQNPHAQNATHHHLQL